MFLAILDLYNDGIRIAFGNPREIRIVCDMDVCTYIVAMAVCMRVVDIYVHCMCTCTLGVCDVYVCTLSVCTCVMYTCVCAHLHCTGVSVHV